MSTARLFNGAQTASAHMPEAVSAVRNGDVRGLPVSHIHI